MASPLPLIIHERRSTWAAQVRFRMLDCPVRIVETRSTNELLAACTRSACPILVFDLADRPVPALADLERAMLVAPNNLSLVLDPSGHRENALVAHELGATHVLSGRITPPAVSNHLRRWLPVATRRAVSDGWAHEFEPELELWEILLDEELESPFSRGGRDSIGTGGDST